MLACNVSLIAGGYTQLPRNLGPFEIGMSKSDFKALTNTTPESCPICIDNELFATLDSNALEKLDAGETGGDGTDFFFFNNKLYHISAGTAEKDLFTAQQDFEHQFGGPGKTSETSIGSSALVWEDNATVITLNYRTEDSEVFSVNFYDWNLKEERDWRESLLLSQSVSTD